MVTVSRTGRDASYAIADGHIAHVVEDALLRVLSVLPIDVVVDEHTHGADCSREAVSHGDHTDFMHDGHQHAGHYDAH